MTESAVRPHFDVGVDLCALHGLSSSVLLREDLVEVSHRMRRGRNPNNGALLVAIVSWLAHAACASAPSSPSSVPAGVWGGDHVSTTVAGTGTHFEFDCAHGDGAPLVPDARGQFNVTGVFVREHGGPIRQDDAPDSHPATYSGTVTANAMTLTVRLADLGETVGTFTLAYGSPGRVVKCL